MIRGLLSLYSWRYPQAVVYMLQNTDYHITPYLKWYWRTKDFSKVTYRRQLDATRAARLLLWVMCVGSVLQIMAGLFAVATGYVQWGIVLLFLYPVAWAHLVLVPVLAGRVLLWPLRRRTLAGAEVTFRNHPAIKIAITGSYGKTSMKELLLTVLGAGKHVVATPANKNVAIAHAQFARTLTGNEDIVLLEYGEGAPGDVATFARLTHPTHAVVTGIAPAHLDQYKTVERAAEDIFSVADFVDASKLYVNGESPFTEPWLRPDTVAYSQKGAMGWKISEVRIGLDGTEFVMKKGKRSLKLRSRLVGRHQLGPLAFAAVLADDFGLSDQQIAEGIAQTKPFEHRMQPYQLNGAWVIDDTYNGNIEGIRAGTALLRELPATRKIYVTPGLVEQGREAEKVHREMGRLIAGAKPDIVVLMHNSTTAHIAAGLEDAGYRGEIRTEDRPLEFYTNLKSFVARGDLVLMQNDWTDNYA